MSKGNLEERLRMINQLRSRWYGGEVRTITADDYKGIHDSFIGSRGTEDFQYNLFLDKIHKRFSSWKKYVTITESGELFKFKPYQKFQVEGKVLESGTVENFEYYLVKVTKLIKE